MAKITIYVEMVDPAEMGSKAGYRVVRTKNTLSPRIGEVLPEARVKEIIASGKEVIVDTPRVRNAGSPASTT